MKPRCQVCGEFQSENTDIIAGHGVCYDCVDRLVENEVERRGVANDARLFAQFHSGIAGESERQQLRDAGRGRG